MKNLIISAFAFFAILLAGCQEIGPVMDGGNVTFALQAPESVSTKAVIGDGENVNIVYYEIYLDKTGHKNDYREGQPLIKSSVPMRGKEASLSLNLLEDQNYVALFWAQVDGYDYYNVEDLRKVEALYQDENGKFILSNDEARAAFCQVFKFDTEDYVSETVTLVRPFAQLNLGTEKEFLNDDYLITLQESKMKVEGVGTAFNVAKMGAYSDTKDVVFEFGKVPQQDLAVNGKAYAYAGMNYFFVPNDASNVEVTYEIMTDVGTVNRTVTQVPVKKNYRTNILGNLLTKETVVEIVVDERFNEDLPNTPYDPSLNIFIALREGGEVTLGEDLVITKDNPLIVTAGPSRPVTIDLNGYDIVSDDVIYQQGKVSALISVQNGSVLTIKDSDPVNEGTVESLSEEDYAVEVRNGLLNIEGGNYVGAYTAAYAFEGVINISGGRFSDVLGDNRYVLNLYGGSANAEINVTGGTFVGFDPSNNVAENPAVDFVEFGYRSFDNGDGTWTVREHVDYILNGNCYEVYTADGLAKWAYMANHVDNTVGLKVMDDITLPAYEIVEDAAKQTYKFSDKAITVVEGVPSGSNWVPVGLYKDEVPKYYGSVDGNDKTISNLLINNTTGGNTGFIGYITSGTNEPDDISDFSATIKNLSIKDSNICSDTDYTGVIVGRVINIKGIENCHVYGSYVRGKSNTGGIAGRLYTRISDIKVVLSDCSVDSYSSVEGTSQTGGIVGMNYGSVILHCTNAADVKGTGDVGGIVGQTRDYHHYRSAYVIACINTGDISASGNNIGGIAGYNLYDYNHTASESVIVACASTAETITGSLKGLVAGRAYANSGTILNKYNFASWALKTSSTSNILTGGEYTACYAYDSAASITQADVDAMNAAIADYNSGRSADDQSYCPYTWSWTAGSLPVLQK